MDKKLNAQQVEALFNFTRQHFVEYYDLQAELVDHLAHGIETQWQQRPELDFNQALDREFSKFGVFGFMDVVEKRQAALNKRYFRLVWHYFISFFRVPQILATATLAIAYFTILHFTSYKYEFAVTSLLALTVCSFALGVKIRRSYNKKVKLEGKKWLLEEIIFNAGAVTFILLPQLCQIAFRLSGRNFTSIYFETGFAALFLLISAMNYIMLFVVPAKAEEHLKQVYPEYNLKLS